MNQNNNTKEPDATALDSSEDSISINEVSIGVRFEEPMPKKSSLTLKTKRMKKLESAASLSANESSASSEDIVLTAEQLSASESDSDYANEGRDSDDDEDESNDKQLFSNYLANIGNLKYPIDATTLMLEYGHEEDEDDSVNNSDSEAEKYKKIEDLQSRKRFRWKFFTERPYLFRLIASLIILSPFSVLPLIIAKIFFIQTKVDIALPWYRNQVFLNTLFCFLTYFLLILVFSFALSHAAIKLIKIYFKRKTNFSSMNHYSEYLKRIHMPLTCFFWFVALLISWNVLLALFCQQFSSDTCLTVLNIGSKVLTGFLVSALFWTLEKMLLQMTAVRFHSKPYEARILENRKACYVISQLKHIPKKVYVPSNSMTKRRLRPKELQELEIPVAPCETSQIQDMMSTSSTKSLSSATGIGREPGKFSKFHNVTSFTKYLKKKSEKKKTTLLRIIKKTRRSTDIIFAKCALKDRNYIVLDDFCKYFRTRKFARESFAIFDLEKSGKIVKKIMNMAILQILVEKNYIMKSLMDLEDVLAVLNNIYFSVMFFILFFIWLAIFELPVQSLLSVTLSLIAATVFVISDAARSTFSSIIFLFSLHPYDVGDKVIIDGENLLVTKLHLLVTVFRAPDGQEIYLPNALLATKRILNVRRSADTWESFNLQFDYNTSPEKIQKFKESIEKFVESSPEDFHPSIFFVPSNIAISKTIDISLSVQHKSNWQNGTLRWTRHTKLLTFIMDQLRSLHIQHFPVSKMDCNTPAPLKNFKMAASTAV